MTFDDLADFGTMHGDAAVKSTPEDVDAIVVYRARGVPQVLCGFDMQRTRADVISQLKQAIAFLENPKVPPESRYYGMRKSAGAEEVRLVAPLPDYTQTPPTKKN